MKTLPVNHHGETYIEALQAFPRYMNRPIARVHVYTWHLANLLENNCPCIRLLRPFRDETNRKFRWRLAQVIKARRFVGRELLPCYVETTGEYINKPTR